MGSDGEGIAARRKEHDMDGNETGGRERPRRRRRLAATGLVAGGVVVGAILAGSTIAGAARGSASSATPSAPAAAAGGARMDPATVDHGPGETLLTGSTADDVSAAALDAVPGGTIIRVETDSGGAAYEAHVRASDGSVVTVTFDTDLNVTDTASGFGAGPAGAMPGAPDAGSNP
jgi:hypothetical protein